MRTRYLTILAVPLALFMGLTLAQAQSIGFGDSDQFWRRDTRLDAKQVLCHIPPGNPANAHTIEVPQSAVAAHLAHGDTLGACPDEGCDCPPYPAPVPATGQTTCIDLSGENIPCAGTGQDGEYQMGVSVDPRFTDSGNGTVRDHLTGLIWLKNADCFGRRTWPTALTDANTLASNSCGLSDGSEVGDWRLPNLRELSSLIEYNEAFPALQWGHPFSAVQESLYWSSSSFPDFDFGKWAVSFETGAVRGWVNMSSWYVWPVRGPE